MPYPYALLLTSLVLAAACDSSGDPEVAEQTAANGDGINSATAPSTGESNGQNDSWYKPPVAVSWQWQLGGVVNTAHNVTLYDIDLLDTPQQQIDELHSAGRHVICYFSAGSYEEWREDAAQFLESDKGNALDGWPGERWLDIRSGNIRRIMQQRLDLAQEKNCDGVEPDNVDGYANNSGFDLTGEHQLGYNRFLATEAHKRGLSIGLKNDLDQIVELEPDFDFAVNEQCFQYFECDLLMPFIEQGKPVLGAEYESRFVNDIEARDTMCTDARSRQFSTLILPINLDDSFRLSCTL